MNHLYTPKPLHGHSLFPTHLPKHFTQSINHNCATAIGTTTVIDDEIPNTVSCTSTSGKPQFSDDTHHLVIQLFAFESTACFFDDLPSRHGDVP